MIDAHKQNHRTPLHRTILDAIEAGITAAKATETLEATVEVNGDTLMICDEVIDLCLYDDIRILGGGNAAGSVATVLAEQFDQPVGGTVISNSRVTMDEIDVLEGDHPLPTHRNVVGSETILEQSRAAGEDSLVISIIGGGGSALLAAPVSDIPLKDYQATVKELIQSGINIQEANVIRKHCSAIKGGQLAASLKPASVQALVFSDVVGDELSTIASGPLWPDDSTFDDALHIIEENRLELPESVLTYLQAGADGEHPETPQQPEEFGHVQTHLIANVDTALTAAMDEIETTDYESYQLSTTVSGAARDVGQQLASIGIDLQKDASVSGLIVCAGGETTVTVNGMGTGGPSQECVLSAGIKLATEQTNSEIVIASVDTDGIDGESQAAGAIVETETVQNPREARRALAANDTGTYLEERNALIKTGPTGTNVNDLYFVGIE